VSDSARDPRAASQPWPPPLHPWNKDFTWQDHTGPYTLLQDFQARQFDDQGYVVIDHAFTRSELEPVAIELDGHEALVDAFLNEQDQGRFSIAETGAITFAPNLTGRSTLLATFARHPVLLGLCRDLIGPDVNLYWDQAVYKKPEKPRRFPWHQDNGYKFIEPQAYLTCWIAVTAATEDNGCPHVAPALHRRGTLEHTYVEPLGFECFAEPPTSVAAPVAAGGAVVFSSLTPHLTGPNTTDDVRKAYILQYAPTGAAAPDGDPDAATTSRVPQDNPAYQFPVLRNGLPV
jgi:phytanoyl-CoA hydroxylase